MTSNLRFRLVAAVTALTMAVFIPAGIPNCPDQ